MADVEITYNNSTIASLSDSGTEVLETNGTYLTDDITVQYTKSGGTAGTVSVSGSNTSQLTVYNGAHHQPTPAGYTVTVSLTNPVNASEFSGCGIVEQITSANMDTGSLLGSVPSASGNETVTVSESIYGINVTPSGTSISVPTSGISCTGGVTYAGSDGMGGYKFEVTGNGTVTFDGIDYDD